MEMMRPVFGQVADYFEEMGVSADILELIKTVSSSQIRILIQDELERWGLGFKNVVAEELERNELLGRCGEEYTTRYYAAENKINSDCQGESYACCTEKIEKDHDVEDGLWCRRLRMEQKCGEAFTLEFYGITASIGKCKSKTVRRFYERRVLRCGNPVR